jgi:hypothetical protein
MSWASEAARSVWADRFRRILLVWPQLEYKSVVAGMRPCALIKSTNETYADLSATCQRDGLNSLLLTASGRRVSNAELAQGRQEVHDGVAAIVGSADDISRFQELWREDNHSGVGILLGYPRCCVTAFAMEDSAGASLDPTWRIASASVTADNAEQLEIEAPPLVNVLWRWIGIRAIPHLPCCFTCEPALALAEQFMTLAGASNCADEGKWIRQILSWPAQWSALHGIAEIKTPVLRFITRTDATPNKYIVNWKGSSYPTEGATGLSFPFAAPSSRIVKLGLQQR